MPKRTEKELVSDWSISHEGLMREWSEDPALFQKDMRDIIMYIYDLGWCEAIDEVMDKSLDLYKSLLEDEESDATQDS